MPIFRSHARWYWAALLVVPLASCTTPPPTTPTPAGIHRDAAFTQFFRQTSGWIGGDGAISIPCSDGRVLWLFGDSHVDDYDPATGTTPCLFQTRNAGMIHDRNDLQNPATLVGRANVQPFTADRQGHVFVLRPPSLVLQMDVATGGLDARCFDRGDGVDPGQQHRAGRNIHA